MAVQQVVVAQQGGVQDGLEGGGGVWEMGWVEGRRRRWAEGLQLSATVLGGS